MNRRLSSRSITMSEPVATVVFYEETVDKIRSLYTLIDADSDGMLTVNDFDGRFSSQAESKEKWETIRNNFDNDADGHISFEEFLNGFKKMTLHEDSFISTNMSPTLEEWLGEIEKEINVRCQALVDELFEFLNN
eukprot:m.35672 g.35672  ORF g.35672 m.35672 type:complete len:135 (+) comp10034_c0_seq1:35-439(+)